MGSDQLRRWRYCRVREYQFDLSDRTSLSWHRVLKPIPRNPPEMSIFSVIEVPDDAAQEDEAMGTKFKFWFHHPELCTCLFKRSRSNTGEDWAEKIAAELCKALGLPHARQELGIWQGQRGTVSPAMLTPDEELIHGNDILAGIVSSYPREEVYNVSQHTLDIVLQAMSRPDPVGATSRL
jgi:hypothetical protein